MEWGEQLMKEDRGNRREMEGINQTWAPLTVFLTEKR